MTLLLKELTELKKSKYGKKDQPLTIACKLLSYKNKVKVLQNCKWFKGCHIYMSEYFCRAWDGGGEIGLLIFSIDLSVI